MLITTKNIQGLDKTTIYAEKFYSIKLIRNFV